MQNIPSLVVSAIAEWNGKALAQGRKDISVFEKGAKSLGKTLGISLGAAALVSFGKASVKAFADAEREGAQLASTMKGLGLSFGTVEIDNYIKKIGSLYGVTGAQAVPAMQALLSATGSVTKSQEIMNNALDIAANQNLDVAEVSQGLAKAYLGNYKALKKYNLGLTDAELAGMSFYDIQKRIDERMGGSATAAAKTYSNQMKILAQNANQAQEIIGKGLIDAFKILAGDTTTEELAQTMKDAAEYTADLAVNLAKVIKTLNTPIDIASGGLAWFIEHTQKWVDLLVAGDPSGFFKKPVAPTTKIGPAQQSPGERAAAVAAAKKAAAIEKARLDLLKKQALAEKNKLALSKAAAYFDSTRISIAAALKATYDKDTRLRLEALMAIEDEDGATALNRIGQIAALQKQTDLDKLAGVQTISSATLEALNAQLLSELHVIDASSMAEKDKEAARQIAFGKYNAAITAAGELADKASYTERVQIQLTEIAKLASLSNTTNAALVAGKLRESAELNMIDRVAAAQKAADDARLKALQDYIALLGKVGTAASSNLLSTGITKIGSTPFVTGPVIDPTLSLKTVEAVAAATAKLPASISATELYSSLTDAQKADLGGYSPYMNYGSGYGNSYNISITTGVIAQPEEFSGLIQDTIQRLNRGGDPLTTAGAL